MDLPELDKLLERRKYLLDWIERNKLAQDMLPTVQQELEVTNLNIQALTTLPDEANEIPRENLSFSLDHENKHMKSALPMIPLYNAKDLRISTDYIISGSTASISTYVARVGELGTEDAQRYAGAYFDSYRKMQEAQSRTAKVRRLIEMLADQTITKRYDVALEAYTAFQSGTANRTGTASEIRNLLHGVKLGLFKKAQRWPGENMTWERMGHRLAKGGYENSLLIQREKIQSLLIADLSHILKEQDRNAPINPDHKWSQVLDHIYALISLTKLTENL